MLCSRCRTHLLSRLPFYRRSSALPSSRCSGIISRTQQRTYSTPTNPTQATAAEDSVSTSGSANDATGAAAPQKVTSTVPAGTRLAGLNYFKNKPEVLAMDDSEYPDWLWKLLDDPKAKSAKDGSGSVDVSSMNKKQRKRHEKKMAAAAASKPPVIPLHEQSIDIIAADAVAPDAAKNFEVASTGIEARRAITKSSREARRKSIKESNFLKGL
ncbi:hypothetical protein D8B26_001008 [Coccidioides posadasii str. Silveira]|uniref:Large ribosomal subunit protein mL54 n=3 Tax=Coccidioides posadasii TaxID=199306 RepID=E9CUE8_COCPS|nr:hypothetical protein CPC735_039810 [Coccidioides posadasii C735 delta SOWgp]EER28717.1 hypothetical protein CPC735_039810 [Coccidioides posadasii C735 delta SOWgp]EFW22283.1 conserved hypothetical protein [Coccidioides posadasii str. Silveira]KMM64173.1 hypothetical protein CPAG_00525 [Coccidioides posadasii RMSCC 3488]QVM06296.1 hypothetical protein D8B26_001008 [Coccidioides posadasii str. Silveira]|eukprot:XP_003070862.1 hypothetical protein CPC735_039810 [Coccidioides posadasii C735 delta SOWgp]